MKNHAARAKCRQEPSCVDSSVEEEENMGQEPVAFLASKNIFYGACSTAPNEAPPDSYQLIPSKAIKQEEEFPGPRFKKIHR